MLAGAFLVAINRFETSLAEDEAQLQDGVRNASTSGTAPCLKWPETVQTATEHALLGGWSPLTPCVQG